MNEQDIQYLEYNPQLDDNHTEHDFTEDLPEDN